MKKRAFADPVKLEVFKNLFHSVAEEMGAVLRRSAFSPNIRERRDYSCAVFDAAGQVLAMGDHMPVHLGSMPRSVQAARQALTLAPGDIALLNDPYAGGTHLPDLTTVMPVHVWADSPGHSPASGPPSRKTPVRRSSRAPLRATRTPDFYVASRAHHADIGGAQAGSMGLAREIFEEGLRLPPVKIVQAGRVDPGLREILLANVRTPREREGDLTAQIAACRTGARRLCEIVQRYGRHQALEYGRHILQYSAAMMRAALRQIPPGTYRAADFLDDDGIRDQPLRIAVTIRIGADSAAVDFSGTAPVCPGNVNAVRAITESAIFYVFRSLLDEQVPASSGLLWPVRIRLPEPSLLAAQPPAAVAGGNVETSQRIVDVLLRALAVALPSRIPAASQGSMNNVSFGGIAPASGEAFAYYETIAGGMGARPGLDGISGVHTHMTNSLNTPIEALEHAYPVRIRRYALRRNSGGAGAWRGGEGVVREFEFLTNARVGLLAERRKIAPWGLRGGAPGKAGKDKLILHGKVRQLASKCSFHALAGAVLKIETPGGGGWGKEKRRR